MRRPSRRDRRSHVVSACVVTGVVVSGVVLLGAGGTGSSPSDTTSTASTTSTVATDKDTDKGTASGPATQVSSEGVEVTTYGTAEVHPYQNAGNSPVYIGVHGVQRTDSATVVYLSVGYLDPAADQVAPVALSELADPGAGFLGGNALTSTRLVDSASGEVLATVATDRNGISDPFSSPQAAFPTEPGVMNAVYAVLPPLRNAVDTVDVQVGFGSIVADVPVGEGVFEPEVGDDQVPLGTGWPRIDPAALADPETPEEFRHTLSSVTEALGGSQVVVETPEEVTIDVAADVLFAVDSAELSPQAVTRVQQLAADVGARAAPGQLLVVGHTDSDGEDAYNDDLSRRRAESVAAVLQPALDPGLDLELVVEGRGEREPVADNATPEGRQANRRVSVTFATAGAGVTP